MIQQGLPGAVLNFSLCPSPHHLEVRPEGLPTPTAKLRFPNKHQFGADLQVLSTHALKITLCSETRGRGFTPGSSDLSELLGPTCHLALPSLSGSSHISSKSSEGKHVDLRKGRQGRHPPWCTDVLPGRARGPFPHCIKCLTPKPQGVHRPAARLTPGDMEGHRAVLVSEGAGGRTPGLCACSALQGAGTGLPLWVRGQVFHQFQGCKEIRPSSLKHFRL